MKQILFTLASLATLAQVVFAANPLPSGYLSIPVLITLSDGSTGLGFFLGASNHIFLAAARHLIFNDKGQLRATNATFRSNPETTTNQGHFELRVDLAKLQAGGEIRSHASHDVVIIRFGVSSGDNSWNLYNVATTVITNSHSSMFAIPPHFMSRFSEIIPGQEIFVFGYPSSVGLQQSPKFDYSKPLLRKGIVSGLYGQTGTIIIDSSVYFGNSGGPVIQIEHLDTGIRYNVIGVVSEMIPFVDALKSERFGYSNINVSNSGYSAVEPVDFILELLWD